MSSFEAFDQDQWSDPKGPHRLLHAMTPVRLRFLYRVLHGHGLVACQTNVCLRGLRIVDVGCGGGLISRPLARLGARVVGIDPSQTAIVSAQSMSCKPNACHQAFSNTGSDQSIIHGQNHASRAQNCPDGQNAPFGTQGADTCPDGQNAPFGTQGADTGGGDGQPENPLYIWAPGLAQDACSGWPNSGSQGNSSAHLNGAAPLNGSAHFNGSARLNGGAADGPFDVAVVMDVLEHVPCVFALLNQIRTVMRPKGLVVGTTLNRTLASRILAIGLAERILGWVPQGTHRGDQFIAPDELIWMADRAGMGAAQIQGIAPKHWQDLPASDWDFCSSTAINYAFCFEVR
jgi:2-polyprenyl-3-methyl-5-hydroxy-6-metoxy-1,4-benzoquinol methylase